jgi:DNA-nicking Smr family endonuclease
MGLSHTPFKDLKIKPAKKTAKPAQAPVQPIDNNADEELFREAMAGVREIKEFREMAVKKPGAKPLPQKKDDTLVELERLISGEASINLPDTDEYMEWAGPGVTRDTARRLHRGEFAVQDSIDLHGMTEAEAEEAFAGFFKDAVRKGLFCVKVIHGRGLRSPAGPVLKEALRKWLLGPYRRRIRAFATARDRDGGLGATYVLLRRR